MKHKQQIKFPRVETLAQLNNISNNQIVLLFTEKADKGEGEDYAYNKLRKEVIPKLSSALTQKNIKVCFSNVGGIFAISEIGQFLKQKKLRHSGIFIIKNGFIIQSVNLGFIPLSEDFIKAAKGLIEQLSDRSTGDDSIENDSIQINTDNAYSSILPTTFSKVMLVVLLLMNSLFFILTVLNYYIGETLFALYAAISGLYFLFFSLRSIQGKAPHLGETFPYIMVLSLAVLVFSSLSVPSAIDWYKREQLLLDVSSNDKTLRSNAVSTIEDITQLPVAENDSRFVLALKRLANDQVPEIRKLALKALEKMGETPNEPYIYLDPAGYFQVILPKGWKIEDEYRDDSRGKVLFGNADGTVHWRIIVGGGNTKSLDDLRRNAQQAQSSFPGLVITNDKVNDWDAVRIEGEIGGEFNRMFSFITAEEAHSFDFYGSKSKVEKEWPILIQSINTYFPFRQQDSEELRHSQNVAHLVRLARLFHKIGSIDYAKISLREAIALSPDNPQVLELRCQILGENCSTK